MMRRGLTSTLFSLLAAAALAAPNNVSAQTQARPDDWQFHAIVYGYFPDIGGKTSFPANTGSSINVDASTILDNLKFTFMGTFEARKGAWGFLTDILYMDVGGSRSNTRDVSVGSINLPAGATTDLSLDLKGTVWTLAGTYRAMSTPEANLDLFAGARLLSVKERFGYNFSADVGPIVGIGREGSSEAKLDNWDAVVGVKGRVAFGPRREWFVPWYLDVGTGDSDLTWQAIGGVGYAFSWGEVLLAWRYLDYDFKPGQKAEELTFNGPALGVAFRW